MNIRYNNFINTNWDRVIYNAKVMNIAKDKKFLRKLIYSGKIMTTQTPIPKFSVSNIGNHNTPNKLRHIYFKRLCDYIDVYQTKFGDDWDIHFQKEYTNGNEGYIIYLFKIFDKVTITKYNDNGGIINSHKITDLGVFNTIGMKEDGSLWIPRMKGLRLSFSPREVNSNYKHSHLGASCSIRENPDYLQDFCIGGSSDTSLLVGLLATQFSKEQFELYLYAQDSTIECESSIGTPHIRFSTIFEKTQKSFSSNSASISIFYNHYLEKSILNDVVDVNYYIYNNNYHIKKDEVFHSFIKKQLLTLDKEYWGKYLCKKGERNDYFSYNSFEKLILPPSNVQIRVDSEDLKTPYIYYRGDKKEFKVRNEQPIKENEQLKIEEFIVYPNLLNYIHGKLEHKLQKTAIAGSNIKRYYSRNNVASYLR